MSFNFNFNVSIDNENLQKYLEQINNTDSTKSSDNDVNLSYDVEIFPDEEDSTDGDKKIKDSEYEFEIAAEAYFNNLLENKSVLNALDGIIDGVKDGIFSVEEKTAFFKEIAGSDNLITISEINKGLQEHGWSVYNEEEEDEADSDIEIGNSQQDNSSDESTSSESLSGDSGTSGGTSNETAVSGDSGTFGGTTAGGIGGTFGGPSTGGISSNASDIETSGGMSSDTSAIGTSGEMSTDITAGSGIAPTSAPVAEPVNTGAGSNSSLKPTNSISGMGEAELASEKSLREGNLQTAKNNINSIDSIQEVADANTRYSNALSAYNECMENESDEVKEAETKRSDAQAKIDEYNEQIDKDKLQIAENKNTITSLVSAMNAIAIPRYKAEYDEKTGNVISDNRADINAAIQEREAIQAQIDNLEKENDTLQTEINKIEDYDIDSLKQEIKDAEEIIKEKGSKELQALLREMNSARENLDSVKQQFYQKAQADLNKAIADLDEVNNKYLQLNDEQSFSRDDLPKLKDKDGNVAFNGDFLDYKEFTADFISGLNKRLFKSAYPAPEGQKIADELKQGYHNITEYEKAAHSSTGVYPSTILEGILDKLEKAKEEANAEEKEAEQESEQEA